MRLLLGALSLSAFVFGLAGASSLALERSLASLAPGGLTFQVLRYNPFTGGVVVAGLRGRDAHGREVFSADRVTATADASGLLGGHVTLRRVHVVAPRLRLGASGLPFGLPGTEHAVRRFAPPITVEGVVVTGGILTVDDAGERGTPLVVRDIDVRLNLLAAVPHPDDAVAFAVEMALYGSSVQVTGQTVRDHDGPSGYAVHVRARGIDLAAVLRDFPVNASAILEGGRGDVEGDLLLADGRVLLSGKARVSSVVARWRDPRLSSLRARHVFVAVDRFDVGAGAGRISRLEIGGPVLSVTLRDRPGAELRALLASMSPADGLVVRRVQLSDGRLTLLRPNGAVTLSGVDVAMQAGESTANPAFTVSAHTKVGRQGRVALTGLLSRSFDTVDALVRVANLDLAAWQSLAPSVPEAGVLAFDGRVRVADDSDVARVSGQGTVRDLRLATGFRAESVDVRVRQLDWPDGVVVLDSLMLTRPSFVYAGAGVAGPWPLSIAAGGVTVVDGLVSGGGAAPFRDVAAELLADTGTGAARITVSGAPDHGPRVGVDRWLPVDSFAGDAGVPGVPLQTVFAVLGEMYRSSPEWALPGAVLQP